MSREREREIAKLAERQRGLVTRAQLLDLGLTRVAIDHRMKSARLHALYRGVYTVGHGQPAEGARELGAVLACGPRAAASHRSAAWLWRLQSRPPEDAEVSVVGRDCRSRPGLRVHTLAALDRRDLRRLGGIPITSPARTILDLAAVVQGRKLEQAVAEAQARRLISRSEVLSLIARVALGLESSRSDRCSTPRHLPSSPAPKPRSDSWPYSGPPISRRRRSTRSFSVDTRSTSCGAIADSSSRSTGSRITAPERPSSAIACATPTSSRPAFGSSESPGVSYSPAPASVVARVAAALAAG